MAHRFAFVLPPLLIASAFATPASAQGCGALIDVTTTPTPAISAIHHGYAEFMASSTVFPAPIQPRPFSVAGGRYYFSGTTGSIGEAPYTTTGQPGGTALIQDVLMDPFAFPVNPDQDIGHFTPFNGGMAFIASDGVQRSLYVHDPATQALTMVADILLDPWEYEDGGMGVVNGKLLFQVRTLSGLYELWSSDGTAGGTGKLLDLGAAGFGGALRNLSVSPNGQSAYFFYVGDVMPQGVYHTDGTVLGTVRLTDPPLLSVHDPGEDWIAFLGGDAIIAIRLAGPGHVLYRSDGTVAGTQLLKDFHPTASGLPADLGDALEWNGKLYFNGGVSLSKRKLYETDGTPAGTKAVLLGSSIPSEPWDMLLYNGSLRFTAETQFGGRELFKYDGVNMTQITGIGIGAYVGAGPELTQVGGIMFYVDAEPASSRLIVSYDSGVGTFPVVGAPEGTFEHPIGHLTPTADAKLLFTGPSPSGHAALWIVDPVGLVVTMIAELDGAAGTYGSEASDPVRIGTDLYFSAGKAFERRLWRIGHDLVPTEVAAGALLDVREGPDLVELSDQVALFLLGATAAFGAEPYVLNNASGVLTALGDLSPGPASTHIWAQRTLGGELYFIAETDQGGGGQQTHLYRTDGTAAGTVLVHAAAQGRVLEVVGDKLLFLNEAPATGKEPWLTDGTPGGAALLADLNPGPGSSLLATPYPLGDKLLFVAAPSGSQGTLHVTDGTLAGTLPLGPAQGAQLALAPSAGFGGVVWNGELYIQLTDPATGAELWKSGGTPATTQLVVDLHPGPANSSVTHLRGTPDGVYFAEGNAQLQGELFRTDGTAAGTQQLTMMVAQSGLGQVQALHATVDGLYALRSNGVGEGIVELYAGGMVTQLCSAIGLSFDGSLSWVETVAGGVLLQGLTNSVFGIEPSFFDLNKGRAESVANGGPLGSLHANAPHLGQMVTVSSTGAPSVQAAALGYGPAAAWPVQIVGLADSLVWLDPLQFTLFGVKAGANWNHSVTVPSTPALVGKSVMLQALYLEPAGFPGELSNALLLTIGL